ncbi:MAG: bifunctional 4-hydroxy-2-oxoglutarate aldolase/2-dehydro-3-deoxy-phosphogluconate aldolase [Microbacterium sp.]|nr:bifunctional 4-hydroxy-2-oxoglutarate aldolase/2-dehydro-3-deoxy-phosphogluconate aldolase [Microbacterium sp.]
MMMSLFAHAAQHSPILAILRGFDVSETVRLCHLAWDAGARLVEVPIQVRAGEDALAAAVDAGHERGLPVGAGTVTSLDRLRRARAHGAAFTVAPGFDTEVARASQDAGIPHLPGVATATEVQRALAHGFTWLKAFPAAELGPAWIAAMHGPFPEARFVATGGIAKANAARFLAAGAELVAIGTAIRTFDSTWGLDGLGPGDGER